MWLRLLDIATGEYHRLLLRYAKKIKPIKLLSMVYLECKKWKTSSPGAGRQIAGWFGQLFPMCTVLRRTSEYISGVFLMLGEISTKSNNSCHFITVAGNCVRIHLPGFLNPVSNYFLGKSIQCLGAFSCAIKRQN